MAAQLLLHRLAAVGLASFITGALPATPQITPPRDPPRTPRKPTGIIKGRVVDAHTGAALPRARVRLQAGPPPPRIVLSDDQGGFQFTDVAAGPVSLFVDRAGFMSARYPEAGKSIRSMMRPLTVADGQVVGGITIAMYRGGAIAGRVIDSHGEPAEFAQVQLFRLPPSGRGKPQPRGGNGTNDLGEFRIPRLEPGKYLLRAQIRSIVADDPTETQALPTYYPGVLAIDQAQPIAVERGQTVSGIEIMLMDGRSSVITGTVVDAKGQPPAAGGYIDVQLAHDSSFFGPGVAGANVRPDGSFQMKLPPGEYVLEARANRPGVMGGSDDAQVGRLRVSVSDGPVSGLTVVLTSPASMSGRITFDGDSTPPARRDQFVVALGSAASANCQSGRGTQEPDGTFRITGVMGTCTPQLRSSDGRWMLKSVLHRDVDLTDRPIAFEPGRDLRDVQIVLTDRRSEVALHVTDGRGNATREYVALMFSVDEARWTEISRYVRTYSPPAVPGGRPDAIIGMPPGDYYVVALVDIALEDARDPETLEQLKAGAQRVSVNERSRLDVTLRRIEFQSGR